MDDSDTERASVSPRCDENADDVGTRPHPLFGLTRAERAYFDASGVRGRLPGVRGQAENMTLNIHGPWGILARLGRAEGVLAGIIRQLG